MRILQRLIFVIAFAALLPGWAAAQAPASSLDQAADRIAAREQQEVQMLRKYTPIMETYIQDMRPDKELGAVPKKDHYFLGTAELSQGVVFHSLLDAKKGGGLKLNPLAHISNLFGGGYVPEGFLQMIFLETNGFDRQHYHFDYVRREFLGEVRCLVFDLMPLPKSGNGRFKGRIWVEDQDYTIVRFNGIYVPERRTFGLSAHFDSWRTNVAPGVWIPAYVFTEETDLKNYLYGHVRFKAQTRFWGYNLGRAGHQEEFSDLKVEAPAPIKDQAEAAKDRSPIEARRAWYQQAEQNVVDRLQSAGLIAPPGEVDKVMETVVNNLEVTNNLDIQPEVHCRVLLTSTLESFSIGHTIVISRGLLDVLPDEASLAAMLAHELGHVVIGQPLDSQWGFSDRTMFPLEESLRYFSFHASASDEELADKRAVDILKNSPYKNKLASVGLFLKKLDEESKALPALVSPHMGNRVLSTPEFLNAAPEVQSAKLDQIAALPLGSRIKLDPWTDQVELVKAKPVSLLSEREKIPFEVTPFFPFLTRTPAPGSSSTVQVGGSSKPDLAKKEQQ
jgi:hypothetical protein